VSRVRRGQNETERSQCSSRHGKGGLAPGIEIVSIITKKSAETLGLKPGGKAYAVIKASNVMIGVD
jgi:hypothetical protein